MNDAGEKGLKLWMDVASIAFVVLVLWFAYTLGVERGKYAILFLGISFAISVLKVLTAGRFLGVQGKPLIAGGVTLIVIFLAATVYLFWEYIPLLADRAGDYTTLDVFVGAIIVLPLFLIMWKEGGVALFGLTILFLLYFYLGQTNQ